MNCPGCQQPLQPINLKTDQEEKQTLHQCHYCGSHFLPPGLIQNLTLKQIRQLDSIKSQQQPTSSPHCPHCDLPLTSTSSKTSTFYTCPDNHGQFFPPQQMLHFKQDSLHQSPTHKTGKVVLPLAFFLLALTILPLTLNQSLSPQESRISADQILTQPLITPLTSTQVVISFSTTEKYLTSIQIQTPQDNQIRTVSTTPQTSHVITLNQLQPQTTYTFIINYQQSSQEKPTNSPTYSFTTP